jgi:hypothetical protein
MQETDNHILKVKVMAWQLHHVEVIIDANKCNSVLYLAWEGHLKVTNNISCKQQNIDPVNKVDKGQIPEILRWYLRWESWKN